MQSMHIQLCAYHCNIEWLWHHCDEHVKKQYTGGYIVETEEDLSKAFGIPRDSLLSLEYG